MTGGAAGVAQVFLLQRPGSQDLRSIPDDRLPVVNLTSAFAASSLLAGLGETETLDRALHLRRHREPTCPA